MPGLVTNNTGKMIILPERLRPQLVRANGTWHGRFGPLKDAMRLRPEDTITATYLSKVEAVLNNTPPAWKKVVHGTWPDMPIEPLTIEESLRLVREGLQTNIDRNGKDTSKDGIMLARVAGQAVVFEDQHARHEIKRILDNTLEGGVFVVIGHGGKYACGAVAAKLALLEGKDLSSEHLHTQAVVKEVANVEGLASPAAEWHNAMVQAQRIITDPEFGAIIREKNITVAYTVAVNEETVLFQAANKQLCRDELYVMHPKLKLLALQLEKGIVTAAAEDKGARHFAHATVISDPLDLFSVITPHLPGLEVGGICCVDARLANNTRANIVRAHVGETFFATATIDDGNGVVIHAANGGSMSYAWRHVAGINILKGEGSTGNGHIIAIASNPDRAGMLVAGLKGYDDVQEVLRRGGSITTIVFDGHAAHIKNEHIGYEANVLKTTTH